MNSKTEKVIPIVTMRRLIFIFLLLFFLLSCHRESASKLLLADFESETDLDHLYWNCHTLYSLSKTHVTHGMSSLKMELFPSNYPGLVFKPVLKDWRSYKELCFDIYNPSDQSVLIWVRIDDRMDYSDYKDWYSHSFVLQQGNNHISIPLITLVSSRTKLHLNLAHIHRMFIFLSHPQKEYTLYIDNINIQGKM